MADWRNTLTDPPDWTDGGDIELRDAEGTVIRARLTFDEFWNGDDEVPVPVVDAPRSFFDYKAWRK